MDEFQARTPGFDVKVHSLSRLFDRRVYAISHRPRQYLSPAVQKFIAFLLEQREEDEKREAPSAWPASVAAVLPNKPEKN